VKALIGLRAIALVSFTALAAPDLRAEIYVPGDEVAGVDGEVFGWTRGDAAGTYSGWDVFESVDFNGFTDDTPDVDGQFGAVSELNVGFGGILTGTQNIYSPSVPLAFNAKVNSGTIGGGHTRIVAQFQTGGTELNYDEIFLSSDLLRIGDVAPSLMLETGRRPQGGAFGGETVNYLAMWDLNESQEAYRIDFRAQAAHSSLEEFHLDTFTSDTAFITPTITAIPEPGAFAFLAAATGVMTLRRRRTSRP
jgi:hypothetical protein